MARASNGSPEYVKLEQRLALLAWLNGLFGYDNNLDLLADVSEAAEGFDASGRSYVHHRLIARGDKVKVGAADLARYDDNIREHLRAMNARRPEPITLRYFQHLAVLYTEIFLDAYFNRRGELLRALNSFVDKRNAAKSAGDPKDAKFAESDLKKLAFWMATGSGKTLIMHINYRQFLHYNNLPLDNILLITPNEGLSEQHIEEMTASSIPCRRFDLNESGLGMAERDAVRVIEITKLVEEKRGGGLSVPVESFEGNNLIFVDEGHKGSGGEAWRSFRDALGQTGFTFEYSATFGQALTAARNDDLTTEYGKAIVFDYSYRYFHGDGYGKDFRILNLKEETTEDKTETLLLGNLLSFYEQQRVFEEQGDDLRPYNLEKPLWVFVGSSVNAVYTEDREKRSDVLTVARFLHHLLENKRGWAVKAIKKLLDGKTGLVDPDGQDVFADKFQYLRATGTDAEATYQDILSKVLHTPAGGGLHLCDLRGRAGELGLKASGAEEYFGLIYIGDTSTFKKLVEDDDSGIVLEEDAIADSLFEGINEPDTTVEILIGAKKFMEGWNSWRVSNMGLLNIGRKEGSEIIQLFGRGVRLRGKDFTLKRSSALDGSHPQHVPLLETLNIFAVRANYMSQFREYLEKEGVETQGDVELPLPIRANDDFLDQGLVVPRVPDDRSFADETDILLDVDPGIRVRVDMSLKVQTLESGADGLTATAVKAGRERPIPDESLALVDWEKVYIDLLEYKERKGMRNLAIRPDVPRAILSRTEPARLYSLVADDAVVRPDSFAGTALLNEAALTVLRKYTDKFYRNQQERWDSEHMVYTTLDREDANFQNYTVKVARGESQLIAAIQKLIDEGDGIYKQDIRDLPTIHFDRHLYQPLLIERGDKVRSEPSGLKDSERQFVEDLRAFCRAEKDKSLADAEVFLLRNLSRGKGIGFFEKRGFYPDFILWVKKADAQRIVFVEPHGMLHAEAYQHDDKARLHESLPHLAAAMCKRTGIKDIVLDSFIVSATPFEDLRTRYDDGSWDRKKFTEAHIVFPDRSAQYDYIEIIMRQQSV
ncbi:MAG: DEAD/DEAH box helicase family protein [Verrucomicrobia bacterium]|nr:DEAD/DEAH box helicase family protein [Verrucomicrobiota bacterium]